MTKQSRREFLKGTFAGLVGTFLAWIGIPRLDKANDDDDGWGVVVDGRDAVTQPFGERGSSRGWEVPKRTWDAPPKYDCVSINDTHSFVDDVWVFPLDEVDLNANPWEDLSKFSLAELDAYVQWFGKGQIEVDATKYLFNPQPGHVIWYHLGNQGPGVGGPGRTLYVRHRVDDTLFCSSLEAKRAFDLAWNRHHIVWQEGNPFPVEIAWVDMGSDSIDAQLSNTTPNWIVDPYRRGWVWSVNEDGIVILSTDSGVTWQEYQPGCIFRHYKLNDQEEFVWYDRTIDVGSDSELEDIKCDQITWDVDFRVEPGQAVTDQLVGVT